MELKLGLPLYFKAQMYVSTQDSFPEVMELKGKSSRDCFDYEGSALEMGSVSL